MDRATADQSDVGTAFVAGHGGGIVPSGALQAIGAVQRFALHAIAAAVRLPAPLRDRVLLTLQRTAEPSSKNVGGIPIEMEVHGGVPVIWLGAEMRTEGVVVFLHGGGYLAGPNDAQWAWLAEIQKRSRWAVAAVLYGMAPARPFPAALDDACTAISAMSEDDLLIDGHWVLAGDSAGGGLALATAQERRRRGEAMPAGLILIAPWVDLEMQHPDLRAHVRDDPLFEDGRSLLLWGAHQYADGVALDDPRLSPINGSMDGLPPVHLDVGTRDLLLPDIRRLKAVLEAAGARVTSIEQEGAGHVYSLHASTPEGEWAIRSQLNWLHDVRQPPA